MATLINAANEYYLRDASLPSIDTFTMMVWARRTVNYGNSKIHPIFYRNNGAGDTQWIGLYLQDQGGGTDNLLLDNTATGDLGSAIALDEWHHIALTKSGSDYKGYLDGGEDMAFTNASSVTNTRMYVGGNAFTDFTGTSIGLEIADLKIWDGAALSEAEIKTEMRQYVPVLFDSLHGFWPMLSIDDDQTDYYTGGLTMTVGGTPSAAAGSPPIPWRRRRRRQSVAVAAPPGGGGGFRSRIAGGRVVTAG
jgi:hypothetical protein